MPMSLPSPSPSLAAHSCYQSASDVLVQAPSNLEIQESMPSLIEEYVSMADVTDISKLVTASDVRVIDFSVFISIWCGVNIDLGTVIFVGHPEAMWVSIIWVQW
ncbi:unnamed protein product [Camellia sinensis]